MPVAQGLRADSRAVLAGFLALLAVLLLLALPGSASAAEFVVTTEEDVEHAACAADCSLRDAVAAANADPSADTIVFAPGVEEIDQGVTLHLRTAVTIAGCAPGEEELGPCVGVRGRGGPEILFEIEGEGVTLADLALSNAGTAVGAFEEAAGLSVVDSWIGIRIDGTAEGNAYGVFTMGDYAEVAGNVFAGHDEDALTLRGADLAVEFNLFGLEPDGVTPAANRRAIVLGNDSVLGSAPTRARIADNLIGSTTGSAIDLGQSNGAQIVGNVLGRTAAGAPVPIGAGITTDDHDAHDNVIGGDTDAEVNEISSSSGDAIRISRPPANDSARNLILRNVGTGNGAGANDLFIDLGADGPGNGTSANLEVEAPVTTASTASSLAGTAEPGAVVRLFARPGRDPGDLGALLATTTAGGDGRWSASFAVQPAGTGVSATQTVAGKGTSELSVDPIAPQPPPPPPPPVPDTRLDPSIPEVDRPHDQSTVLLYFTSTVGGSTFECSIDGGAFRPCRLGYALGPLPDGRHTFAVRARSPVGLVDPTPATRALVIDTRAPETRIVGGPRPVSNDATPTLRLGSSEPGVVYECKLDRAGWGPCRFPTPIANGGHRLQVRARDLAGNYDRTPAQLGFRIDMTAPKLTVTGATRRIRGALLLPVTCPKAEAAGPCRVRLAVRQGRKVLGRASAVVRKGRTVVVRLRLKRPPRKGTRLTVAHTTTDAAGNRRSATARVRVR